MLMTDKRDQGHSGNRERESVCTLLHNALFSFMLISNRRAPARARLKQKKVAEDEQEFREKSYVASGS